MPLTQRWKPEDEGEELASPRMTPEEYEASELADLAWLVRERAEHEALSHSLEEELDALFALLPAGEPATGAAATPPDPPDPPGWPAL